MRTQVKLHTLTLGFVIVAALLAHCGQSQAKPRSRLCYVTTIEDAYTSCHEGDIVVFLPLVYGNEQLPVLAAAAFCDHSKSIALTIGGVSCVFTRKRQTDYNNLRRRFSNNQAHTTRPRK